MTLLEILQDLYGDNIINVSMKVAIDFLGYLLASLLGSLLSYLISPKEQKNKRGPAIIGFGVLSAVLMFMFGIYLLEFIPRRIVLGISVLLSISMPVFSGAIKSGDLLFKILHFFTTSTVNFVGSFLDILKESRNATPPESKDRRKGGRNTSGYYRRRDDVDDDEDFKEAE